MGATLTTISDILKNQYLGPIREQLNNEIVLLSRLEKDDESVVGKNFTIPLHVGRNEGIGSTSDGGNLPDAGNQGYKSCIVPMRYQYGRIQLTGPTMKASASNEGAFIRALEAEMKGLARDLKSDLNRQLYGDGSGILATCASATDATTIVVGSTAKLRVGMKIDILVSATGAATAGVVGTFITGITDATTFTISTGVTTFASVGATYSVYRSGSRNLELMGLGGIISNADPAGGALQGLDVASYAYWKANILTDSSNRAITEALMQTALDTTEQAGAGKTTALYTSYGVRRAYQALLTTTRQYSNTMELKGGYKALDYNSMPLIADKDAPKSVINFVDEDSLKFYRLADWDWMDQDGAVLSRVAGKDAYEATMFLYSELGCGARNANTRLEKITEA